MDDLLTKTIELLFLNIERISGIEKRTILLPKLKDENWITFTLPIY